MILARHPRRVCQATTIRFRGTSIPFKYLPAQVPGCCTPGMGGPETLPMGFPTQSACRNWPDAPTFTPDETCGQTATNPAGLTNGAPGRRRHVYLLAVSRTMV